ncbi:MAG: hypothetical protein PHV58_00985 [Candidatus Omnitrophica bacterium]|nr:hypothetical protein [Candidatus Omnitrophota bacterium]MDD5662140.1 hypothetical protein [Candidatus Omnitrophota bacterium]
MDKEEAITGFLKGLRIAINNALAYSRQHPYFLKSTQEFKEKIDALFTFLDPIKVSATSGSLFLDGKYWDKIVSSVELAQILHQRKIKSIEFKSGLVVSELADALSFLALQPKEILKKGGLSRLLRDMDSQHIRIEELDYSGLLGGQGEATKDIWLYLFNEAVEKQDAQKINEFADNFSEGVKNLSVKKVIEDNKLRENLHGLLHYLKDGDKEKYLKCSRELSSLFLNSGVQISTDNVGKLKGLFSDLDGNDFADLLLSQVSDSGRLNTLNLELFSRLAGEERAEKIAFRLADKVKGKIELSNKPALYKKIKDLLSGPDAQTVSPAYHLALATLIKDISFKDTLFFDRGQLRSNYRTAILNLLIQEKNAEDLNMILEKLDREWGNISQDKDYQFLKYLLDALRQKNKTGEFSAGVLESIEKRIGEEVEKGIWDEAVPQGLALLADALDKSYLTVDFYLDKIFRENKLNTHGLKLFLRFFPASLSIFYEYLRSRRADLEFLNQAIQILSGIDLSVSLPVLKEVFFSGNELIKLEVLEVMRNSAVVDTEFLFSLLEEKSIALRKGALRVLRKNDADRNKALDLLLGIPSPWGSRNQLILENVKIVEDLWLEEAGDYLVAFSKRRFFWNKNLRNAALEVLKKWK